MIHHDTAAGSQLEHACHKNYQLIGQPVRICLDTGYWSGSEPYCRLMNKAEETKDAVIPVAGMWEVCCEN